MRYHLHIKFAFWITVLIVAVASILGGMLALDARKGLDEVREVSVNHLRDAMHETARLDLASVTQTLADNLVNPVYDKDMLQIRQLLANTLQLPSVTATYVFEPDGSILNDGLEMLPSYGTPVDPLVSQAAAASPGEMSIFERSSELVATRAITLGNEVLGGVAVHYDQTQADDKTAAMTTQLNRIAKQSIQRNERTALLTTGVMLLAGILLGILMALRLSRPIRNIADRVQQVGQGNYGIDLPSSNTREIDQLARSVKQMAGTIADTTVSRNYLKHIVDSLHEGLAVIDDRLRIQLTNRAACVLRDDLPASLIGSSFLDLIEQKDVPRIENWLQDIIRQQHPATTETHWVKNSGSSVPIRLSVAPLLYAEDKGSLVCVFQDINKRRRQEERVGVLAHLDTLTGLPNRELFFNRLDHAMKRAARDNQLLALLYIDLDDFKNINERFGDIAGDKLLRHAAKRLQDCTSIGDTVARMGGDEFAIIIESLKNVGQAESTISSVIAATAEPFGLEGVSIELSISIGVVYHPFADVGAADLVHMADVAMYQAKGSARACYAYCSSEASLFARDRLLFENELRHALERGEFRLVFQPQIEIATGWPVGYETLLRWSNAELGDVSPLEFVPALEDLGLIGEVGAWVLEQACTEAAKWKTNDKVRVTVNLSAHQLDAPDLVLQIKRCLARNQLPPAALELEIAERALITDAGGRKSVLGELSALGISIAIDDFGTAQAPLGYLNALSANALKMDRAFIDGLPDDESALTICRSIAATAKTFGLRIVAEGVETQQQLEVLKTLQVTEVQGAFSGKPLSPENICSGRTDLDLPVMTN